MHGIKSENIADNEKMRIEKRDILIFSSFEEKKFICIS